MSPVPVPPPPRARIEDDGVALRVVLPPRRDPATMVILVTWVLGWVLTWLVDMRGLLALVGLARFVGLYLVAWVASGLFGALLLLWAAFGNEILELRAEVLIHRRLLFGRGLTRTYDLGNLKRLRVEPRPPPSRLAHFVGQSSMFDVSELFGVAGGPIVFEDGSQTIRCGAALDEAEAKQIIERFGQRDARLRPPAA